MSENSKLIPLIGTFLAVVPAVAFGADSAEAVAVAPYDGEIIEASYITKAGITGADANTRKVTVINKGLAGAGTAEAAALQFNNGTDATAFNETALTLNATLTDDVYVNRQVLKGDVLAFVSAKVGTGIADPGGLVVLKISRS